VRIENDLEKAAVNHRKPIACVVLPTYNEARNIVSLVPEIFRQAREIESHLLHIVVVDDDSPDGTRQQVSDLQKLFRNLHLLTGSKKGLGYAYKKGFAFALDNLGADLVIQMDADGQHDPKWIPLFIQLHRQGFDLVIGSRFVPGSSTPDFRTWRKYLSLAGSRMTRSFGRVPIRDCTSGFRCISAEKLEACDAGNLMGSGYSFQAALLCALVRNNARAIEVPICFKSRKHGHSKLTFLDQVGFLLNLFRIQFQTR